MAVDMFLKLDPIKGESMDHKHKDQIEVLSWSWGMAQTATGHSGSGAGAGKVNVQDLNFTHYVDKASPDLMKTCCNGKHIDKATMTVRKAGGNPLEYIKLEMEQVYIAAVTPGGSHGEERLTENVTLNFHKFKYTYIPQNKDGSGGTPGVMGWDISGNKEA